MSNPRKRRRHSKSSARTKSQAIEFRETLALPSSLGVPLSGSRPEPLSIPTLGDLGTTLRKGGQEALRYGLVLADATAHWGGAAARDASYFGRRAVTAAWNKQTRRAYLSLLILGGSVVAMAAAFIAVSTLGLYASDITSPATLIAKKNTGITLLDRNGQLLYRAYGAANRVTLNADQMPKSLSQATLSAEDPHFYDHPGFSWQATSRAIYVDLTKGSRAEGGSTITQQLVKNALLNSNKTFERKFQEILLSVALEQRYNKDQILNMYLNETYYGEGSYGVGAAAQTYFHKSASDLTLGETAMLAGLPLGPSRFDPNVHPESALGRRNYVLERMASLGQITTEQAKIAEAEPLTAYAQNVTINAPHFVFYVLDQLRAKYGDDQVEQGGMTVITSLDLTKQVKAQGIVAAQINKLSQHHVSNGGLVSLDPTTGDIISMVGSADYNAPGYGAVNITLSSLQPGSSFKPFAYVTAFKKGWNGSTIIQDAPLSLPAGDGTTYTPQNYDGRFHGNVTVRHALDNSLNIPAVKTMQYAGLDDTIQTAHDLGITTLNDRSSYGLSLVLGSGEVKPLEMAVAYAGFDTGGLRVTPRSILEVRDRTGKAIEKTAPVAQTRVLDPRLAYMITNILSDNGARQPEFPLNSPLKLSRPAAAKTGTTNDFRDNWTVGYTPNLVTAVWVGNNDHTAMQEVDGITGAAPIWHDYMEMALADMPVLQFGVPAGVVSVSVCPADGGLAYPGQAGISEVFLSEAVPTRKCSSRPMPATPVPTPSPMPEPGRDDSTKLNANGQAGNGMGGSAPNSPTPPPSVTPTPTKFNRFN